ncbi:hypothetical protein [Microcystis aeruginosa]|uniref:hypothetical protein n=1 Tax=Microcystis aeruginosa TaxID=1126 RepID=UPI0012305C16|nr:hypothetical protein [Microcystis aeruginosa]
MLIFDQHWVRSQLSVISYQLSVISYQLTEKTPHTLHPTPYTLHPVPRKNFLPQTLDREKLVP